MAHYRVVVSDLHSDLERELTALGATVHTCAGIEEIRRVTALTKANACVLDADELRRQGLDVIRQIRRQDASVAVLLALGPNEGAELAEDQLTLASGADAGFRAHKARVAARQVLYAIANRHLQVKAHRDLRRRTALVVDWDETQPGLTSTALQREGFDVDQAHDTLSALRRLRQEPFAVLICPPGPRGDDVSLVDGALRYNPRIRIVVVSSCSDLSDTVSALSSGAFDYLIDPVGPLQAVAAAEAAWIAFLSLGSEGAPAAASRAVLVVDAKAERADLTKQLLAPTGFEVTVELSLDQARALLGQRRFDAIALSPEFEGKSPFEVVLTLHEVAPDVPLLLLCNEECQPWTEQLMSLGVEDILFKETLGQAALPERVEAAVTRARYHRKRERFLRDLQLREDSQQEVIRRSLDGMLVIDQRGFVVFANPAAEKMFHAERGQLLGTQLPVDSSDPGPLEAEIRADPLLYVEKTCVAVDFRGARATLMTLRDVTERRRARMLREGLAHTDRLAAMGQMSAGVAHEINNPAAFVVANLTTMQRELAELRDAAPEPLRPRLDDLGNIAEENLQGMARIQSITRNLLGFSRLDSNEIRNINVNDCVDVACNLAMSELRPRATLVKQYGDLPALIAYPGKLSQVVTNLLINAAQAIPEGNAAHNRVLVKTEAVGDKVVLTVEDTGSGIEASKLPHIFDPFFTTKAPGKGTGLGLALSADMIAKHGGSIQAENAPGGGARFVVELPLQNGLHQTSETTRSVRVPPQSAPPDRLQVLVIDDEPLVLRSLRRMLKGHDVVTAESGHEGLALLAEGQRFDIVFCDLIMPEMDGPTVYDKLLSMRPELADRVVFCSGGAFTPRTQVFLEQCSRPLVQKPLTVEVFETLAASFSGANVQQGVCT